LVHFEILQLVERSMFGARKRVKLETALMFLTLSSPLAPWMSFFFFLFFLPFLFHLPWPSPI
jgi:succinate dehydrogenase/fumarate reductase cytochrome b subunit